MPLFPSAPPGVSGWLDAKTSFGARGDGAGDDTAALQSWINAAQSTGRPGWLPPGTYKISATLTVSAACTLAGAGVTENWGSFQVGTGGSGTVCPRTPPYLSGSVIMQSAPNRDALLLSVQGQSVHLRDFGIVFGSPFAATGHGINAQPPLKTSYADGGITASAWDNLAVYGHDGNHYGYRIVNPIILTRAHCRSYGGGGLYLRGETDVGYNMGNIVDTHSYVITFLGGSAHGFSLSAVQANALNLCRFTRPQAWVMDVSSFWTIPGYAPPTSAQWCLQSESTVALCAFDSPDMESNVGSNANFPAHGLSVSGAGYVGNAFDIGGLNQGAANFGGQSLVLGGQPGGQSWIVAGGYLIVQTRDPAANPLVIRPALSSSADLTTWQDYYGSVTRARVTQAGDGQFNALQPTAGARITSGSGAPTTPGGANPSAGDFYFRTDGATGTHLYFCSVGGATPTWVAIA